MFVADYQAHVQAITASLDDKTPGLILAAALSAIDVHRVSGHNRIKVSQRQDGGIVLIRPVTDKAGDLLYPAN